jgi:hypothetical protein
VATTSLRILHAGIRGLLCGRHCCSLSLFFFGGLSGEAASASDRISSSAPEIAWLSMCHEFDDAFFFCLLHVARAHVEIWAGPSQRS